MVSNRNLHFDTCIHQTKRDNFLKGIPVGKGIQYLAHRKFVDFSKTNSFKFNYFSYC